MVLKWIACTFTQLKKINKNVIYIKDPTFNQFSLIDSLFHSCVYFIKIYYKNSSSGKKNAQS